MFCQEGKPPTQESSRGSVAPDRNGAPEPTAGMTDIHDIKDVVEFPGMPFYAKALLAASAVLLAILSICLAVRYLQGKKKGQASPAPLSPEEAALKTLGEIRNIMDTDAKAFYFRLSLALREFMEGKFSVKAAEMTTEELVPLMKSLRLEEELESGARRFFEYSDPVKFAGAVPERIKMEDHFKFVRYFVKTAARNSFETDASQAEARPAGNEPAAGISESG